MKLARTLALLLLLGACAAPPPDLPRDGPASPDVRAEAASVASLSLADALARADQHHQDLAAWRSLVRAAEGRLEQAGSMPNPDVILRMENVPLNRGTGGMGRLINQGNYIAGVGQELPLGGRLSAAEDVAARELDRERAALAVRRAEVHAAVRLAHGQAVIASSERGVRQETVTLTEQAVSVARARVTSGDATPDEVDRVEIDALEASVELERAVAAESATLRALALATGVPGLQVTGVAGDVLTAVDLDSVADLLARAETSPALRLARAEVEAATARVSLAQAERWPDLGVEVLYRRLELTNQHSVDAGLRIGLPIFDRRSGEITARRAELDAAGARERGTRTTLQHSLITIHEQLAFARSLARRLADEALPRAERALRTAEARWRAGDLSLTDVAPVRRALLALRLTHIQALRTVAERTAELERLLGARELGR